MNIGALLSKAAASFPHQPAISLGTDVWSNYRNLHERAGSIASGLRKNFALKSGDRVAITMSNRPEFLESLFGIWYAGLVAVPINSKLHPAEFSYIFKNSGTRLSIADKRLKETLDPISNENKVLEAIISVDSASYNSLCNQSKMAPTDVDPEEPAWLFYTSGTTGRPKGATLTHRNLLVMTLSYFADMDPINSKDSVLHAAPLSHGSGLYALPHIAKAANNIIPSSGAFNPAEILSLIPKFSGITLFAAPTMIVRLMNSPEITKSDFKNLKLLYYGGAPMHVEDVKQALKVFGPKIAQIYGQGESPMTISYLSREFYADAHNPAFEEQIASAGIARTDVEFRVVDERDNSLAFGEAGEILVRGDVVMKGYWEDPEATASALRNGWLHTGDIGSINEQGFLTLLDRSKDMIISGGTNIYPREIEEIILRHPEVVEVAVVGKEHDEWGEEVVAFVVTTTESKVDSEVLDNLCLEHIARFKRPKKYYFETNLPKNNYGKVMKKDLRRRLDNHNDPTAH